MDPTMGRKLNIVAAAGLAVGAVFGLAGTIVTHPDLQATLWAIDSVGLVMATTLLTVKFLRKGCDVIAAGFLVFAIGESVILSGTAAGLVGSIPSLPRELRFGLRRFCSSVFPKSSPPGFV